MVTSFLVSGLLAVVIGHTVNARGIERRQGVSYPTISTAYGGQPAEPTVTAPTGSTSEGPSITLATSTASSPLPLPTDLGQSILAAQNGTNGPVVLDVSVNGGGRNKTAPLLYGWMHEDISHSGDGGLYAELLVNRAFQGSGATIGSQPGVPGGSVIGAENPIVPFGPVLTGWQGIGGVDISLTRLHRLSDALPTSLQMDIPTNASGEVGLVNPGWWGIDVRGPQVYNASFYILANGPRNNGSLSHIDVSLRSNITGETWASSSIQFTEETGNISDFYWTQYTAQIHVNTTAPNSNNTFVISFDASEVAGNTYYFALASLFPETYNNRPNGLRPDLVAAIKDLGTTFLRFPGGNNIEGYSIEQRWKWNETIGPLKDRPGRVGDWGYYNTQGFGLNEYLELCEDIEIEPLLAVYAGFSLDIWGQEGTSFPEDRMGDVLQDILNELEYAMGNSSTPYGKLRAEYGHPEPFQINYVEIGNEDWFSTTYPYRFPILYEGIKKAYPNITLVSTAYNENAEYNISIPAGGMWDTHHYEEPTFFVNSFDFFDNWQETTNNSGVTINIGEYSSFQLDTPSDVINFTLSNPAHIAHPNLVGALGEAVYLLGAERNPNVVKMSSYAPSFQNYNWLNWDPDLVGYTANHDETVLSVSWYAQQTLALFRGTETLPVTTKSGDFNNLFWVSTIDESKNAIYFKVVNIGNSSVPLTVSFDASYSSVNGTILTSPNLLDFNYIGNATAVSPKAITDLPAPGQASNSTGMEFQWNVPKWSINVLQFNM